MTTCWTSRPCRRSPARVLILALGMSTAGCGYSGGEALFMLGFGRGQKVEAQFRLTERPVLILIDDHHERISWPIAKQYLESSLHDELIKRGAAKTIVPRESLRQLRQTHNFVTKILRRIAGWSTCPHC